MIDFSLSIFLLVCMAAADMSEWYVSCLLASGWQWFGNRVCTITRTLLLCRQKLGNSRVRATWKSLHFYSHFIRRLRGGRRWLTYAHRIRKMGVERPNVGRVARNYLQLFTWNSATSLPKRCPKKLLKLLSNMSLGTLYVKTKPTLEQHLRLVLTVKYPFLKHKSTYWCHKGEFNLLYGLKHCLLQTATRLLSLGQYQGSRGHWRHLSTPITTPQIQTVPGVLL